MERARLGTGRIDNLGIFVSGLCIIHCVLTPLLLISTTFISFNPELLEKLEIPFLLASSILVFYSITTSLKLHKRFLPLIFALCGLGFVMAGGMFHELEVLLRVTGSLLIVASHISNKRLIKSRHYES